MNERVAYTVVEHGGKRYAVSTINRESSAAAAYGATYAETMVFLLGDKGLERIVAQDEAPTGSTRGHERMVERITKYGENDPPEDEA